MKRIPESIIVGVFLLMLAYLVRTSLDVTPASRAAGATTLSAPPSTPPGCFYLPVTVTRVKDADTVVCDIHLPLNVTLTGETLRAGSFDAWEASKRRRGIYISDEEVRKGKDAAVATREYLAKFHNQMTLQLPKGRKRGKYGRILGTWYVGGKPLRDWMKQHHFLRPEK